MTDELQEALRLRARQLSKNVSDLSQADIDYVKGLVAKASGSGEKEQSLLEKALKIRAYQLSRNVSDFTEPEIEDVKEMLAKGSLVVPKPKKSHKKKKAKVAKAVAEPEVVEDTTGAISEIPTIVPSPFNFSELGTNVIPEE